MTADAVAKTAEEKVKAWGIPSSDFIDDVEKFLSEKFKSEGASDQEIGTDQAEAALRSLDELLQKYKMFQAGLSEKVPFKKYSSDIDFIFLEKKIRRSNPRNFINIRCDQTFIRE